MPNMRSLPAVPWNLNPSGLLASVVGESACPVPIITLAGVSGSSLDGTSGRPGIGGNSMMGLPASESEGLN